MIRNQVLWKNPYAQPIITFKESNGKRVWMIDCCTQSNLFKRKDYSQGSHLSGGYCICLVRESNKEQWYTNSCSYFLRSLPRHHLMFLWNIIGDKWLKQCYKSGMKGQWSAWWRWRRTTYRSSGVDRDRLCLNKWLHYIFLFCLFILPSSWTDILTKCSSCVSPQGHFFNKVWVTTPRQD